MSDFAFRKYSLQAIDGNIYILFYIPFIMKKITEDRTPIKKVAYIGYACADFSETIRKVGGSLYVKLPRMNTLKEGARVWVEATLVDVGAMVSEKERVESAKKNASGVL